MKRIAVVQSNYIPWKGYFDLIASVDEFILYDDVQFTRRDWRNRNLIKTPNGLQWLTVPVRSKGKYLQAIRETEIEGHEWAAQHWRSLVSNYARAAYFREIAATFEPLYGERFGTISALNRRFIDAICAYLGVATKISWSWDYPGADGRNERLAELCAAAGADTYVSGPAARAYLDEAVFAARGVAVEWFDYSGYPPYPQLWGPFEHGVTILDLLFNRGLESRQSMKFVGLSQRESAA
jgi:hypothetical protein